MFILFISVVVVKNIELLLHFLDVELVLYNGIIVTATNFSRPKIFIIKY